MTTSSARSTVVAPRRVSLPHRVCTVLSLTGAVALWNVAPALAQCSSEKPPLLNYTGGGQVVCPCFAAGEQAGAVFQAPVADYPLEILRVGMGWGSVSGGQPQSLEEAIHVYAGGLPNPGTSIFTLDGPLLTDGTINQFDFEPAPGQIVINSGPFSVSLEFANSNDGNIFAPSVVHDGNGCVPGHNLVYSSGWNDACALGVTGDWVFFVVYRPCPGLLGVGDETRVASSAPAILMPPRPNPTRGLTELEFLLAAAAHASLGVYDIAGRRVASVADGWFAAGDHRVSWDGRGNDGGPVASGVYYVDLKTESLRLRRSVLVTR